MGNPFILLVCPAVALSLNIIEPQHEISNNVVCCGQQRLRPACEYAQSDQSLCQSLKYSMTVKLLTEQHLEFLSSTGGCTGSSESTLFKMPHSRKSNVVAHIWASSRENLSSEVCEQQRRRPACAAAQSDQRLCYSLIGKDHI